MATAADLRLMQLVRCQLKAPGTLGLTPHPHMLRHTFVTTTLDAGVDLRDVQIAAGTPTQRTTMRYDRAQEPRPPSQVHPRRLHGLWNMTAARDQPRRPAENRMCAVWNQLARRSGRGVRAVWPSCRRRARRAPSRNQSAATAAIALISRSAPGTARPATRAAVTSGGAPARASRGAIAP